MFHPVFHRALDRALDRARALRPVRGIAFRVLAVSVCTAVSLALVLPAASADDLNKQRDRVTAQMAEQRKELNESSHALNQAVAAVETTQTRLASARQALATTRAKLAAAQVRDRQLAAKLVKTQQALAKAKAAVIAGQQRLDAEKKMAGSMVRDQYQQQTNLLPVALLLTSETTADLSTRLQWSTTMFDTTKAQIDRFTAAQRVLDAAKARQTQLEQQVAADRQAAAKNLAETAALEKRATALTTAVASLLSRQRADQAQAAREVASDKAQYAQLTAERSQVEQRIAARVAAARAAARAAAARRAAAVRAAAVARQKAAKARAEARSAKRASDRARAERIAEKAERAAKRSADKASSDGGSNGGSNGGSSGGNAAHGFDYPVSAPITSPYGMRFHPILHYWKLHDGTDFGASCGTPMRAPYSGKVVERYYNAAYGNRLMIDHGEVDGSYVTTGYNHAIRYTVSVGEHVSKGEVIGYVGTTGWSTGCHLHLMVWMDGKLRNPMSWF